MTDQQFIGILMLLTLASFVIGFVLGWSCREENDES